MHKKVKSRPGARPTKVPSRTGATVAEAARPQTDKRAPKEGSPARWRGLYALVPVAWAVITSLNTLWNHFASDDLEQVLRNTFIRQFSNLPTAFTTSVWSFAAEDIIFTVDPYYRPVFSSLFTINYALFGTAAWGWHLVNILIHAAVTWMVFAVVAEITERRWLAALAAILFASHPVHSESVAWVSGVTDPLMALFLLPAFYLYLRYKKSGKQYLAAASVGLYLLALLSKESAIALPLMIAYCELFHFNRESSFGERLLRLAKLAALFAPATATYFLMRYHALGSLLVTAQPRYPLAPALLTVPLATVKYLALMLIPAGYSYQHYTDFVERYSSLSFVAPLLSLAFVVAAVVLLKSRELKLALVWFIVMLAPALAALRQFEPAYLLQERYLYVPSIGICLALALGLEWLATRASHVPRSRTIAAACAVLLVGVWSVAYIKNNGVWQDTVSVYRNSVAVAPRSPMSHAMLSRTYYDAGKPREAEAEARAALDLDPACAYAHLNLSYFARTSGKLDRAAEHLEEGLSKMSVNAMMRHDMATMHLNLGLLYAQLKDFTRAEQNMLRSIDISPRAVAWYYTGQFYFDQRRYEDSRRMFELTLGHVPHWFAPIHVKLGLVYDSLSQPEKARAEYEKYLEIAPPDARDREDVKRRLSQM